MRFSRVIWRGPTISRISTTCDNGTVPSDDIFHACLGAHLPLVFWLAEAVGILQASSGLQEVRLQAKFFDCVRKPAGDLPKELNVNISESLFLLRREKEESQRVAHGIEGAGQAFYGTLVLHSEVSPDSKPSTNKTARQSMSVAELLPVLGSVTPAGAATVAVLLIRSYTAIGSTVHTAV